MELVHYSRVLLEFDRERTYAQQEPVSSYIKPVGFWVSDDTEFGWKQWCESEEWNTESLKIRSGFAFAPGANVLHLTSVPQLLAFTAKYGVYPPKTYSGSAASINWPRVAREYDGILITPYQWEARLDHRTSWFYGWDCASGCIWNLAALEQVTERTEVPLIPGGYTHTSIEQEVEA